MAKLSPAGAEMQEKLRAVLPEIASLSAQAEQERKVPERSIALVKQTGFFRAFQPKRYGGLELRIEEYGPALVDLSEACTVTGWVGSLFAQHVHAMALFKRELQDDLWASDGGEALLGSSVAPIHTAETVDGGMLLSGKFGFSSGCDHADWFILGFKRPDLDPPHNRCYAIVPRKDLTIVDDWHTMGMRGTGSKTLMADKVFVPDHRMESLILLNSGKSRGFGTNDSPIFHAFFGPHFGVGFAAVAIGTVRRMITLYMEKQQSRIRSYTGVGATTRSPAVMRLGRAAHTNEAAYAFLEKDWRDIDERCFSGQLPTPREVSSWRTGHAFAIQLTIQAADELFNGSGASAWYENNELQRHWRNVHMCGAHAGTDYDTSSEIYGRNLLGLPPDPTLG